MPEITQHQLDQLLYQQRVVRLVAAWEPHIVARAEAEIQRDDLADRLARAEAALAAVDVPKLEAVPQNRQQRRAAERARGDSDSPASS